MSYFSDVLAIGQYDGVSTNDGACAVANGSVVPLIVASFTFSITHYHIDYGDAYWPNAFNNYAPLSPGSGSQQILNGFLQRASLIAANSSWLWRCSSDLIALQTTFEPDAFAATAAEKRISGRVADHNSGRSALVPDYNVDYYVATLEAFVLASSFFSVQCESFLILGIAFGCDGIVAHDCILFSAIIADDYSHDRHDGAPHMHYDGSERSYGGRHDASWFVDSFTTDATRKKRFPYHFDEFNQLRRRWRTEQTKTGAPLKRRLYSECLYSYVLFLKLAYLYGCA